MPTFLVAPPPPQHRMHFMDALEAAGIDYSREPDGYYIYLRQGQQEVLERVCHEFQAEMVEENPASMLDG